MDSSFDYSISSLVVNNIGDDEFDNDFDNESNSIYHEEDASEISFTTDMDTSVIDSDYEDHESGLSEEAASVIHDSTYENDISSNSVQTDSEQEFEEEEIEPKSKKIRLDEEAEQSDVAESVDPSQKCPICLGAWSSTGEHRLCSLRCGHLFGYKCIKQWLNSNNEFAKKCPQCNAKASLKHKRFIYANKLTSVDTTEIERMKKKIEEIRLRELKMKKALRKQKARTRKYKKMCRVRTLALATDSDICFSD